MSGHRLLTYREVADLLGCSPKTVERRVRAGALAVVVDGGLRRIPEGALAAYVAERLVPAKGSLGRGRAGRRSGGMRDRSSTTAPSGSRVRRLWEDAEPTNDV